MTGFIKLNRAIVDWEWYKDINTSKLFFHMLIKANWNDMRFQGEEIPRGAFVSSYRALADETGLSVQNVRTALKHLKRSGELTVRQHCYFSSFFIFYVENYDFYLSSGTEPESRQCAANGQRTDCQHATNTPLTHDQHGLNTKVTPIEEKKNKRKKYNNTRTHARGTGFSNFPQREYDMDELEKQLLECQKIQ